MTYRVVKKIQSNEQGIKVSGEQCQINQGGTATAYQDGHQNVKTEHGESVDGK